jgi:signal transduction histidine kinase
MFKSIFQRFLIPSLIITLALVISLTAAVSWLYRNAFIEEKHRSLEAAAAHLSLQSTRYLQNHLTISELNAAVNAAGSSTESMIYLLNVTKAQFEENPNLHTTGLEDAFIADHLKWILEDKIVFSTASYSETASSYVLFQGYPIRSNDQTVGAVLMLCPVESLSKLLFDINLTAAGITAGVFLFSTPWIWWHSRRITDPIRKMESITHRIAAGENTPLNGIQAKDELGRLSVSFIQMKDQLEKTEALRKDLIANVSHELRTPLTSIHGFIQSLMDGIVPEKDVPEILSLIHEETKRLIRLTSDLLELAKLQSDTRPLKFETFILNPMVDQILTSLKLDSEKKNLRIFTELAPDFTLHADPEAFRQILFNLLDNAIKYSYAGESITLRCLKASDRIEISVEDTGIGINENDLPMVFDKFFRTESQPREGTGLGLSITKQLVQLHKGTIRAEKNGSQGTIIRIFLPK